MKNNKIKSLFVLTIAVYCLMAVLQFHQILADKFDETKQSISVKKDIEEVITLESGDKVIFHQPPRGWEPTIASDEELSYFGYPEKPKNDIEKLKEWEKIVKSKWEKPEFKEIKHIKFAIQNSYQNYCGYLKKNSNKSITGVNASWQQVSLDNATPTNDRPASTAQWVGLYGGSGGDTLVQIGTNSEIAAGGTISSYSWYEVLNTNLSSSAYMITSVPVAGGDNVFARVSTTQRNGVLDISFYISNTTKSKSTSFTVTAKTFTAPGGQAYWVVERPLYGNGLHVLPSFIGNNTYFWAANYKTGTGSYTTLTDNNTDVYNITMKNGTTTLAQALSLNSNGNFTVQWKNYK